MRIAFILTIILSLSCAASCQQISQGKPAPKGPKTAPAQEPAQRTQASEDEVQAQLSQTAAATIEWEKGSTPGMKAEVLLIKKEEIDGKPLMRYRVKVSGAPHNQLYTLIAWPVTFPQPAAMMEGLAIATDGTVGCPKGSTKNCAEHLKGAELRLAYSPGIGEIYRHALISEDKKFRVFFSFVPFPILATDKTCSLEVVELKPGFGLVIIRGSGFQPGEGTLLHMQSYQEIHDETMKADAQGQFKVGYTPYVKGRTMGVTDVTAAAKGCSPKISFNWGAGQ
jgi:hypothetical protein